MAENPIRAWRRKVGLGLGELARKLGVSYHTAWVYEVGHRVKLSPRVATKLAELGFTDAAEAYRRWREAV